MKSLASRKKPDEEKTEEAEIETERVEPKKRDKGVKNEPINPERKKNPRPEAKEG